MRQAIWGAQAPAFLTVRVTTGAAVLALLAGCQSLPGIGNSGGDATRTAPLSDNVQSVERDVEAPEIYSARDRGLWDGRPSLGGIWIAAPDVTDPERVLIRNEANGESVVGALFKRERDNPGPVLQLSSDAAEALGVVAGQPTILDVVALRREEVSDPAVVDADDPEADDELNATATPDADADAPVDAVEIAAAALDAVEAPEAAPTAAALPEADASAEVAVAPGVNDLNPPPTPEVAAPRAAKRGNFFQRLFRRNPEPKIVVRPPAIPLDDVAATGATADVSTTALETPVTRTGNGLSALTVRADDS